MRAVVQPVEHQQEPPRRHDQHPPVPHRAGMGDFAVGDRKPVLLSRVPDSRAEAADALAAVAFTVNLHAIVRAGRFDIDALGIGIPESLFEQIRAEFGAPRIGVAAGIGQNLPSALVPQEGQMIGVFMGS